MKLGRKKTGGIRTSVRARDKILAQRGSLPTETKVEEEDYREVNNAVGKQQKTKLFDAHTALVVDPKTNKIEKTTIKSVLKNQSNRRFERRNIITKGAEIDTELGPARVTSRPGQSGLIQAVLLKK